MQRPQQQSQQRNDGTIAFYNRVQDRCAEIAAMPVSQHDVEIIALSKQTGLTPATIAPIIEKYAAVRVPDYPQLAARFIAKLGRDAVRAMLATNYGKRELTRHVQAALTDERLRITGPRVSLFIDAIKAEFQGVLPSELTVSGSPTTFRIVAVIGGVALFEN